MTLPLATSAQDRVLILAPHPDDESLAAGGLIQVTLAAGGAVRVLLLTDGDNNPWPQRWIEKRWRIGTAERARWGARRRAEAQQALQCLGLDPRDVRFIGLPDLGLTDLLMRNDASLMQTLVDELRHFRPTRLVLPGLQDRHPDHSAAHVLGRIASHRAALGTPIERLSYLVHTDLAELPDTRRLALTPAQVERKRAAIAAHATQVRLSGRRFLGFARADEYFIAAVSASDAATHTGDRAERDAQTLRVHLHGSIRGGEELLLALEHIDGSSRRTRLALPLRAASLDLHDAVADRRIGRLDADRSAQATALTLHTESTVGIALAFVKRQKRRRGLLVFDRAGWFEAKPRDASDTDRRI